MLNYQRVLWENRTVLYNSHVSIGCMMFSTPSRTKRYKMLQDVTFVPESPQVMSKILMPSTEKQLKFGSAYVSEALGLGCLGCLGCLGWLGFPKNLLVVSDSMVILVISATQSRRSCILCFYCVFTNARVKLGNPCQWIPSTKNAVKFENEWWHHPGFFAKVHVINTEDAGNHSKSRSIWVCLKMLCTPKPSGFADHYPYEKLLFHWED